MPLVLSIQGRSLSHPDIPVLRIALETSLPALFSALGLQDPEVSMLLTDDTGIQEINRAWRDEDRPTDVLSFPLFHSHEIDADVLALGDIAIDVEYAERLVTTGEHRERVCAILGRPEACVTWTLIDEVVFLTIHGLLHLIGHDHGDEEEERAMMAEEGRLWQATGR